MNLVPSQCNRLRILNISNNTNAWPQEKYKNDVFYQYALSNHCFPESKTHEQYFSYICYHKVSGEFVGYIQGYLPSVKKVLWIQTFLVDKKYLRQGYGTEFYKAILNILWNKARYNKIYLACFKANIIGCLFWDKLEFIKAKETVKFSLVHGQQCEIYIYEKTTKQKLTSSHKIT